jgi:hypothetical protein
MNILRFSRHIGLLGLFLSLASCDPGPQAGGGIGGTGSVATISSGPVTKFGSVFVSGREYDNSHAIYCLDDEPCSSENRLKLGMVVLVNGRTTESYSNSQPLGHIADKITFEETVEGAVQSVAADGLSVTVLGQVVHIDQKTIVDTSILGQSIANLRPRLDRIEVSGFVVGDGHILATLIMMQTGTPHYEVQGTIKNHDATARTFEIGSLRIDYSTADTSRMPPVTSSTWDRLVVHIQGDPWSNGGAGPSGGTLNATRVTLLGFGIENSEEAELEGFILQINGPGDFVVNNLRVQTTSTTVFEGGTLNDLVLDTHVIIHGKLASGILQAEQIAFEGNFELESNVVAIDGTTKSLTLVGLSGMAVLIDNHTAIGGNGDLRSFEGIHIGDHIEIHGRASGSSLLATELERSGSTSQVKIQGPIQSVSSPMMIIGGATIDTTGIPNDRFIGKDGTTIGRSAFFQGLTVGHKVSLNGTWTGSAVTWTSARLKT